MQVERKELLRAVRTLQRFTSSRPGIPALTGTLMRAGAGGLELEGTDLEVAVRVQLEGVNETGGEGWAELVPVKLLSEILRASKSEAVGIGPVGANFSVAGTSVRTLVLEDYPNVEFGRTEAFATVDGAELAAVLDCVTAGASVDDARPVLCGVLLEWGGPSADGRVRLVATDSYRLHVAELPGAYAGREGEAIVPRRALVAVRKHLGKRAAGRLVLRAHDAELGIVLPDGTHVVSRLIEGEFPNYRKLIPDLDAAGEWWRVDYDRAEILERLAAAAAVVKGSTSPVRLDVGPEGGRLSASSPDRASYAEPVGIDYAGPAGTVAFNPSYLRDAISAVGEGGRRLMLRAADGGLSGLKPAVVLAVGDPFRRQALVMPVRLPEPVNGGVPGVGTDAPPASATTDGPATDGGSGPEPAESEEPDLLPCGCPVELVRDEGHQEGCPERTGAGEPATGGAETADSEPAAEGDSPGPNGSGEGPGPELQRRAELEAAAAARADRSGLRERTAAGANGWHVLAEVAELETSATGRLRVRVLEHEGARFVGLKRWVDSRRYSGPSKGGGVMVPAELAGELGAAVLEAGDVAEG